MPFLPCLRVSAGLLACWALCACARPEVRRALTTVYIPSVVDAALSWRPPEYVDSVYGLNPLGDGPRSRYPTLAVTRAILRTNARLAPFDAFRLAAATVRAARANDLAPEFLAATLLQESAFDPQALSSAGAAGIAQFMPETAARMGVDPFDPFAAIDGAAALLGSYVRAYAGVYPDAVAAALAAYNAGPGAVSAYHGVPPYAETRGYIADVADRWAKIAGYETPKSAR